MATVNIGSLKFNWKGAYNGSTAYSVDDVTSYNGSSYICILASTGNLPTNTTYFQPMATKGTDGTDVGTTLTTQGDILYRDGSGLARLGAGSSGQVLQTGGTGANPSWGTVSSDFVKLGEVNATSGTSVSIDGFFSSTYKVYKIYVYDYHITSSAEWLKYRYNYSNSAYSAGSYKWAAGYNYRNSGSNTAGTEGGWNTDYIALTWWGSGSNRDTIGEITMADPLSTAKRTVSKFSIFTMDASVTLHQFNGGGICDDSTGQGACTGITIFPNGGTIASLKTIIYGLKA